MGILKKIEMRILLDAISQKKKKQDSRHYTNIVTVFQPHKIQIAEFKAETCCHAESYRPSL